jgi:cobalt-precorrin 5A hydrolase/precorrin-3B C17-methyltransferase
MTSSERRIVAIGFSPAALPVLRQLEQAGLLAAVRWPQGSADVNSQDIDLGGGEGRAPDSIHRIPDDSGAASASWLAQQWGSASAVVAVGACGLVTRLIAPLLGSKDQDPAVIVVDPLGQFAVPLLGGHLAGADQLSREIAALLGGQAVIGGSSGSLSRLALDAFGLAWGWRRGSGDWRELMLAIAGGRRPLLRQENGLVLWQGLEAVDGLLCPADQAQDSGSGNADPAGSESGQPIPADTAAVPALVIGPWLGDGCRWHPPCLWLGIGCERNTSLAVLERLIETVLHQSGLAADAVAGLASIDRKGDEPALLALAAERGWPLKLFSADQLAAVAVPNPSEAVAREMGTASVAEAAAWLAAAATAPAAGESDATRYLVTKTIGSAGPGEQGAATLAVTLAPRQWAPQRGELHLVGSGPGRLDLLSGDARRILAAANVWVGYGPYLDLLEPLRRPDQLRRDGQLTEERARCSEALDLAQQGLNVALISSGDSGIYGMAGLALELWLQLPAQDRPGFDVHPGLSALQLAAARAGAPLMHDFCTISLSDRLTPWEVIERRLRAAAEGDFVVALYNPRSRGRDWQLGRARELLLAGRPAGTPVVLARQLGRPEEQVSLHTLENLPIEQVDMLTLVLIGNSSSRVEAGRMVTPRGYPGAELA